MERQYQTDAHRKVSTPSSHYNSNANIQNPPLSYRKATTQKELPHPVSSKEKPMLNKPPMMMRAQTSYEKDFKEQTLMMQQRQSLENLKYEVRSSKVPPLRNHHGGTQTRVNENQYSSSKQLSRERQSYQGVLTGATNTSGSFDYQRGLRRQDSSSDRKPEAFSAAHRRPSLTGTSQSSKNIRHALEEIT